MDDNKRVELLEKIVGGVTDKIVAVKPELKEKIWANLNSGPDLHFTIKAGNYNKAHFHITDEQIEVVYDLVTIEYACPWYEPIDKIDSVIVSVAAHLADQGSK